MVNEFGCQHLLGAAIYNVIAMPIGAGALYPSLGLMLRPEFGALAMSAPASPWSRIPCSCDVRCLHHSA